MVIESHYVDCGFMTLVEGIHLNVRRIVILSLALIVILGSQVSLVRAESDLWSNPDYEKFGTVDYTEYYWFVSAYMGFVAYEIHVEYLENTNPSYDYYAIYLIETINPSSNQGYWGGWTHIISACTKADLLTSRQMVVDYLPDRTTGIWNWQASFGIAGDELGFTVTSQYNLPDVVLNPNPDTHWGGFVTWTLDMLGTDYNPSSRDDANKLRATIIVRTYEGDSLYMKFKMDTTWRCYVWGVWITTSRTLSVYVYYDGTPSGGRGR